MIKRIVLFAVTIAVLSSLLAFSDMKMVEADAQGGLVKYRRHGIGKDSRHDEALAKADDHCKKNGFATYKIENEFDDGRFHEIKFSCRN
jgi:hypothetical protein